MATSSGKSKRTASAKTRPTSVSSRSSKQFSTSKKPAPTSGTATSSRTPFSTSKHSRKIIKTILLWLAVFIVTLICVDFAVQYLNYKASAAIVNGERIYQGELVEKLRESYASSTIDQLIDEALIRQEGEKKEIVISEEDIDDEVAEIEENYGGKEALEAAMAERGVTMESLREQIRTTLVVEEILKDKIEITEEEKQEFYEQYKEVLLPDNENPTYEEAEQAVIESLTDQKLNTAYSEWITVVREGASIKNNIDDPKGFEFLGITRVFINDLTGGEE